MGGLLHNLRNPRRCYMVCATARSGSNLLTDGLHATRRAGRPKQFFLPKFEVDYGAKHGLDPKSDFAGYTRGILAATATSNEVFGFKVMGWYLEEFLGRMRGVCRAQGSDLEVLQEIFPRLTFIRILRRNKLRQAISKAKAIQSGLWKVQPGKTPGGAPDYDRALVEKCLSEARQDEAAWTSFFARNAIQPWTVYYEDLCSSYDATIRSALKFLRIKWESSQPIKPATVRQSDALSMEWERLYLSQQTAVAE